MWDAWVHLSLIRPPGQTLLHIPAPRESSFPAVRTRSHARGGGAREREGAWGGGGREGKQTATRDAALNRCPHLAPTCLFLKAQASAFF